VEEVILPQGFRAVTAPAHRLQVILIIEQLDVSSVGHDVICYRRFFSAYKTSWIFFKEVTAKGAPSGRLIKAVIFTALCPLCEYLFLLSLVLRASCAVAHKTIASRICA
jgi:hypothetical protein